MTYNGKRLCRGCGCTDDRACISFGEACTWVLVDIATPTGFCSFCAEDCEWDPGVMMQSRLGPVDMLRIGEPRWAT